MAYYHTPNYHQDLDSYHYNHPYLDYNTYNSGFDSDYHSNSYSNEQSYNTQYYDTQTSYNQTYDTQYYDSQTYDSQTYYETQNYDTQFYGNGYQQVPTQSIIGYYHFSPTYDQHEIPTPKKVTFQDPVSTEFISSTSATTEAEQELEDDLAFKEYSPDPYHGGYDMVATYGKPLPPSSEICYPPTKKSSISPPLDDHNHFSDPNPKPPNGNFVTPSSEICYPPSEIDQTPKPSNGGVVSQVSVEEKDSESEPESEQEEEEDEEQEEEEEEEGKGDEISNEKQVIRRQIPPGYGLEAVDLCEGVFGGYFPCLWKNKQGNYNYDQQNIDSNGIGGEDDYWRGTADYLFGNPNPYGGSMPERGSYGDPVYSYHRHYPQQAVCEQVEFGGNSSWMANSRYY